MWSKLCEYYASINTSKSVAKKVEKQGDSELPLKISFDIPQDLSQFKERSYDMSARQHQLSKRVQIESIT